MKIAKGSNTYYIHKCLSKNPGASYKDIQEYLGKNGKSKITSGSLISKVKNLLGIEVKSRSYKPRSSKVTVKDIAKDILAKNPNASFTEIQAYVQKVRKNKKRISGQDVNKAREEVGIKKTTRKYIKKSVIAESMPQVPSSEIEGVPTKKGVPFHKYGHLWVPIPIEDAGKIILGNIVPQNDPTNDLMRQLVESSS